MKYLKNTILSIVGLLTIVAYIPQTQGVELDINLVPPVEAQTTSPTPEPTDEPDPSETPQPSPNPSATPPKSPTPSAATTPGLSFTVGVTVPVVSITPSITVVPTKIITLTPSIIPSRSASPSATPTPKSNTGGTNSGIPTTTPTPVEPTLTPTATPTPVPQTIANIQPPEPIKKIADNVYENVIVPPLSFLFQRPAQDFYKESSLTKSTSYSLLIVAAIAMLSGLFLAFPDRLARLLPFTKERFSGSRYLKFINPKTV